MTICIHSAYSQLSVCLFAAKSMRAEVPSARRSAECVPKCRVRAEVPKCRVRAEWTSAVSTITSHFVFASCRTSRIESVNRGIRGKKPRAEENEVRVAESSRRGPRIPRPSRASRWTENPLAGNSEHGAAWTELGDSLHSRLAA